MSNIEWTGKTWNPTVGCSKVSPGCQNCYAMSDLFHESVTFEQLCEIFDVMGSTPHHTYQILTKRPQRMAEMIPLIYRELAARKGLDLPEDAEPPSNIWLGCTVENQATADERIPLLLQTPAVVRFLSCEPLLEELDIAVLLQNYVPDWNDKGDPGCRQIDWVIVGGESGPGARPCDIAWIRSIASQCKAAGVPCFVKQLGSNPVLWDQEVIASESVPKRLRVAITGKGNNPGEWPEDLRVRQMPREVTA